MTDKEAFQIIYDWMMYEVRPVLGGSRWAAPEMAFPMPVLNAMVQLEKAFQTVTFAEQLLGKPKA